MGADSYRTTVPEDSLDLYRVKRVPLKTGRESEFPDKTDERCVILPHPDSLTWTNRILKCHRLLVGRPLAN